MKRKLLLLFITLLSVNLLFASASSVTKIKTRNRSHSTARSHRRATASRTSPFSAALKLATTLPQQSLATAAGVPTYSLQDTVSLAPSSPQLAAVDPFANHPNPLDPLKPARPFWYSVDKDGFTILTVGENVVLYTGHWPQTIDIIQPDGEFVTANAPAAGWEPIGMTVSYPTEEALASNSETPATYLYVVMQHSGHEWRSATTVPAGRDLNQRDSIVPSTNPATESSLLIQVDVTDPTYDPVNYPTGPTFAGALLGHRAGQPSFDPGTGSVYVPSMPSTSLPTTPSVPVDLTSFVSAIAEIVAPEAAGGEAVGAPVAPIVLPLESPDVVPNSPLAWPFLAEGGEGPYVWEFQNLPAWLSAHLDKFSGQPDGIVYGTVPASGSWTFQVRVTDLGQEPPPTSEWTDITMTANVAAEEQLAGELPFAAGEPNAIALQGTGSCTTAATASPGSVVPAWIDVIKIPGGINPAKPSEPVIGCVVAGTAPVSGEYYEFTMPDFKFAYPWDREPILYSGNVAGAYVFDPLPAGVGLSGFAWHEIDKIHDASTEADILNAEFFGVEPFTGQLYQIVLPQGALEVSGAIAPPEISVEPDEVSAVGDPLALSLTTSRADIADALAANPTLKVRFGDLVVEANRDPNIFVTASQIADPTGVNSTIIPIGGATIADGAVSKVSGTRDAQDPTIITLPAATTINVSAVQAHFAGLDSDLTPAVRGTEPGQKDNGVLWVSGTNTGKVAVIDTAAAAFSQSLSVEGATSLGSVSVDPGTRSAYVSGKSLQNVTIFGNGTQLPMPPKIWTAATGVINLGYAGSFTVKATGSPTPSLSHTGTLPAGVTFKDNGNGTATLAGTPAAGTQGDYPLNITAKNGVPLDYTQAFTLTIGIAPVITSTNTTTFTVGTPGSFTVTATATPIATLTYVGTLPEGVTFADNEDGTATLAGTPAAGTGGTYAFTITASNGGPPDATQNFTLVVNGPGGGGAVTLAPLSLSFGSWVVNTTSTAYPVTLTNSGTGPLSISSIAANSSFAIASQTCGSTLAAGAKCNVKVTFTPTVPGKVTGTLTFTDNAADSPQVVTLAGTGVLPAVLSPASAAYGSVAIATTSAAKTFTLTNWQSVSLNNIAASVNGDFAISAKTCSTSLAAKGKCTISVTFKPTATGKRVGMLTVTHSGSNSPSTASLAGTGVLQATLAPISAGFGNVAVGATSAAKMFTLTNNLSVSLNNVAMSTSGDFAISATTCSTSLAAKGKCTISITFKPTAKGTRTGTLTVSDSANNSPHTASLKGAGI